MLRVLSYLLLSLPFLVTAIWATRRSRFHLYLWMPVVVNLIGWSCFGLWHSVRLSIPAVIKPVHLPATWGPVEFFFVAPVTLYVLVFAALGVAAYPPRPAWTRFSWIGPLLLTLLFGGVLVACLGRAALTFVYRW